MAAGTKKGGPERRIIGSRREKELKKKKEEMEEEFLMENGSELAAWEKEGDEEVECTLGEDGKGKMQENIRNNKSFFFFSSNLISLELCCCLSMLGYFILYTDIYSEWKYAIDRRYVVFSSFAIFSCKYSIYFNK